MISAAPAEEERGRSCHYYECCVNVAQALGIQAHPLADFSSNFSVSVVPFKEILDSLKGAPKAHPMKTAERAVKLSAEIKQSVSTAHERLREAQALLANLPADQSARRTRSKSRTRTRSSRRA
jgi:hypothetical protein